MYIIAELGVNHLGSFDRAIEMVDKAIEGGSDFLKFQTYIVEERYDKKINKLIAKRNNWESKADSYGFCLTSVEEN